MHEWALAESIVETSVREIKKADFSTVKEIKIKVGELAQIDLDSVKFAISNILPEYDIKLSESLFVFENSTAVLCCRVCGAEWNYAESMKKISDENIESIHFIPEMVHGFVRCISCGSPDFEVKSGRGLTIDYIEGE
ncbi:hydrogenase nickel incorporation protein HypA [Candidatus Dependentiae bacterium]|nr:hydrogenase nickel incorporation protein HypA [Candidatus Dependentiae bacterium]